jgi:hypothetical protein
VRPKSAFLWTVIAAGCCAFFENHMLWVRPDPLILVTLSAAIYFSSRPSRNVAILGCGVLLGVTFNLKIHSVIYFLPVLLVLLRKFSFSSTLLAGLVSIPIAAAPWFLPNVSFSHFWALLQTAAAQEKEWGGFVRYVLPTYVFMMIPIVIGVIFRDDKNKKLIRMDWQVLAVMSLVGLISAIISVKPGAGRAHMMPLILPIFAFTGHLLESALYPEESSLDKKRYRPFFSALLAYVIAFTPIAFSHQYGWLLEMRAFRKQDVTQDLDRVLERYPGRAIAVGWGENHSTYHLSFFRAHYVWKGNPYPFDLGIQMDMRFIDRWTNPSARAVLRDCRLQIWLIPKGEKPFELTGWLNGNASGVREA